MTRATPYADEIVKLFEPLMRYVAESSLAYVKAPVLLVMFFTTPTHPSIRVDASKVNVRTPVEVNPMQ